MIASLSRLGGVIESQDGVLYRLRPRRSTGGLPKGASRDLRIGMTLGYIRRMKQANKNRSTQRHLGDLISIGPAMIRDPKLLDVESVADLARQDADRLYKKLCRVTGQHHDICVLDTFRAGVAQARNPRLPVEQCQWWYWSRKRKASGAD
jgi:hypothetical protein